MAADLPAARCLDLYAGSGALAFEALSRGAQSVDMVERDRKVVRCLNESAEQLAAGNVEIHQADASAWLRDGNVNNDGKAYNLVFIDPPYQSNDHAEICQLLVRDNWLRHNARVYLETSARNQQVALPSSLSLLKQTSTSEVCAQLYLYNGSSDST